MSRFDFELKVSDTGHSPDVPFLQTKKGIKFVSMLKFENHSGINIIK